MSELEAFFPENESKRVKTPPKFRVVYEDDRVIAFDKSSGISTIPERYIRGISLKEIAEEQFGRLWTVHRLDKETSGVVVFARDAEAHKSLNDQFEKRTTVKVYAAILEGELPDDEMTIDIPIAVDPSNSVRMRPSASGKESTTVLRVRERFSHYTYVEAQPLTGRQHQIRVHCRAIGFPLAVDALYGNRAELMLSQIKRKYKDYGREEKPLIARTTLHAERLTVIHPGTSEPVTFTAELPKDLNAVLTQLRKNRATK